MTSQQWKLVKYAALAVAVIGLVMLKVGATVPVFIAVAVMALTCLGVFKYADKREGEALAQEQRSR